MFLKGCSYPCIRSKNDLELRIRRSFSLSFCNSTSLLSFLLSSSAMSSSNFFLFIYWMRMRMCVYEEEALGWGWRLPRWVSLAQLPSPGPFAWSYHIHKHAKFKLIWRYICKGNFSFFKYLQLLKYYLHLLKYLPNYIFTCSNICQNIFAPAQIFAK